MTLQKAKSMYLCREKCYTDYPMVGFDDEPGEQAPVREGYMLQVPTDKYAKVLVLSNDDTKDYTVAEIKIGYLHKFKDFKEDE